MASPTDKNNDKVDSKQAKECAKSSWGGPPGLPDKIREDLDRFSKIQWRLTWLKTMLLARSCFPIQLIFLKISYSEI